MVYFLKFIQIDLIDMRHRPLSGIVIICMNHWAKFHVLFPLVRKSAAEVAVALSNQLSLCCLRYPKILHSDNGQEFVNEIIHSIVKEWPREVMVVNG